MKRIFRDKTTHGKAQRKVNPFIAEALSRERAASEFKTQMEWIGAKFRALRTEKGYGLEAVAKDLGISSQRLNKIECGTYIHFGLPLFYALSEYYGVTTADIVSVIAKTPSVDSKKLTTRL